MKIRLVGAHPLWGHVLYPASIVLSNYIEHNSSKLFPKDQCTKVLELGAGGGLPGLTSILAGANLVVTTDFPDPDLLTNLEWNADQNLAAASRQRLIVKGLKWGAKLDDDIMETNPSIITEHPTLPSTPSSHRGFDLVLLSDLVFNHSEHHSLLTTCEASLRSSATDPGRITPSLLVFYSHHRPWCVAADEEFFVIARQRGWKCTQVVKEENAGLAFPLDGGDPSIRGTVHGWVLTRC